MYNYSIVLPYYDKYDLFVKAVDSILDREDIQIIVVDNSKVSLVEHQIPCKQKAKITYVTSDNTKGAGCARNVGLTKVEGKYTLFCDADDYFTPEAFDSFDKYLDKECDIVFFKSTSVILSTGKISNRHIVYNNRIDDYFRTHDLSPLRYRFEVPWSKLFATRFIKQGGYEFEETRVCNDALFSMNTGHNAKNIEVSNDVIYVVTEGEANSSLVTTKSVENQWVRYQSSIRKNKFLKEIGHYELRIRLIGYIKAALFDFGPIEALKYIKHAIENKLSIF